MPFQNGTVMDAHSLGLLVLNIKEQPLEPSDVNLTCRPLSTRSNSSEAIKNVAHENTRVTRRAPSQLWHLRADDDGSDGQGR